MPTVQLRDVAVNYQIAGSGEPVVFIPGFATSLRLWDRQIESVSNSYRCVRYDLRDRKSVV